MWWRKVSNPHQPLHLCLYLLLQFLSLWISLFFFFSVFFPLECWKNVIEFLSWGLCLALHFSFSLHHVGTIWKSICTLMTSKQGDTFLMPFLSLGFLWHGGSSTLILYENCQTLKFFFEQVYLVSCRWWLDAITTLMPCLVCKQFGLMCKTISRHDMPCLSLTN